MGLQGDILVSFCVKCFNQESYIGEALQGAFAQTYRPLEIVISDDASTDRSWNVITAYVEEYRRRPDAAKVILNRNDKNLGNLGNWLAICALAKGALLVKADGDDVSMPDRTEKIVAAWKSDGCRATSISHGGSLMGPHGQRMGPMWKVSVEAPAGAVMAFSRSTYESFPSGVVDMRMVDDELFAWRARMLGPEIVLPDSLVRYRLGTGISNSLWGMREPMLRGRRDMLSALHQARLDLEKVREDIGTARADGVLACLDDSERRTRAELMLFSGETFAVRREGFRKLGIPRRLGVWQFLMFAFLLPKPAGDSLFFAYAVVRYAIRRVKGLASRSGFLL